MFEANTDFGEETLVQREFFTGRPFDKQFACRFIVPNTQELSTIGKIYIERVVDSGTEPLFDFILTKVSSQSIRFQVKSANVASSGSGSQQQEFYSLPES